MNYINNKTGEIINIFYRIPYKPDLSVRSKRVRLAMFRSGINRCYLCGIKTKIPKKHTIHCRDIDATLDHIYNTMDIRRLLSNDVKLCCYKCNHQRGITDILNCKKYYHLLCAEIFDIKTLLK